MMGCGVKPMEKQQFKDKLASLDANTRDVRAERWSELSPAAFHVALPHIVWRYLAEAEDMYIYGYYIGVILLAAGTLELALADQIASKLKISDRDIAHFELQQFIVLAQSLGLLTDEETRQLDNFRLLRNGLIHGNIGKLAQMTKRFYQVNGFQETPPVETYLNPDTGNGINQDALRFLNSTRNVVTRFYGEKEPANLPEAQTAKV